MEVIMDGKILDENPKQMGVDKIWLQKQIKDQGYKYPKEILLGLCDDNKTLTLFRNIV
ncbi:MAG: YetF domain-containing protein [Acutalibacteraceae bacterium]|nr:YetF domain-containing protein [Acutalibacteraceae bacterium]